MYIYSNRHAIVSKGLGGKLLDVVKTNSLNGIISKLARNLTIYVRSLAKGNTTCQKKINM